MKNMYNYTITDTDSQEKPLPNIIFYLYTEGILAAMNRRLMRLHTSAIRNDFALTRPPLYQKRQNNPPFTQKVLHSAGGVGGAC